MWMWDWCLFINQLGDFWRGIRIRAIFQRKMSTMCELVRRGTWRRRIIIFYVTWLRKVGRKMKVLREFGRWKPCCLSLMMKYMENEGC